MNSSKVILDKIIADNAAIIKNNLDSANNTANEIVAKAEQDAAAKVAEFESTLAASYDEIIRRSVVVSGLDAKKISMNAKAQAVDSVFEKALLELSKLDKKRYLAIIESILKKYAEDGDTVIISEIDKTRITQKFIDDMAKKLGIKLTLAKEYGTFNGGVILAGKNSDKNLSFDMELMSIKEECETQIADMLF